MRVVMKRIDSFRRALTAAGVRLRLFTDKPSSGSKGGSDDSKLGEGLSKMGVAREDAYFYNKTKEQLQKLKKMFESSDKKDKENPESKSGIY